MCPYRAFRVSACPQYARHFVYSRGALPHVSIQIQPSAFNNTSYDRVNYPFDTCADSAAQFVDFWHTRSTICSQSQHTKSHIRYIYIIVLRTHVWSNWICRRRCMSVYHSRNRSPHKLNAVSLAFVRVCACVLYMSLWLVSDVYVDVRARGERIRV